MKRAAIAFLAMLLAAPAVAQVNPQNLPPSTLYGRMPPSAGPGQAIPFSVLAAQFNSNLVVGTSPIVGSTNGALLYSNAGILGNLAQIGTAYFANNSVTNSILSTAGAATIKGNPTTSTANVTDFTIQGLTAKPVPDVNNDFLVLYDATGLALAKVTPGQIATSATSGVSTLNGLAGPLNIAAGNGIGVSAGGGAVTVSAAAGVAANIINTQTSNYSIIAADAGKTIQAGTGSTGLFTITLPTVSGFAATATVRVCNGDTYSLGSSRGKLLSGFPAPWTSTTPGKVLWPGQCTEVSIINGAWATTYYPGQWNTLTSAGATFQVNHASGSDTTTDCLGTGAGACATYTHCLQMIQTAVMPITSTLATLTCAGPAAGESFTEDVAARNLNGAQNFITFQGTPSTPSNTVWTCTSICMQERDWVAIPLTGYKMTGGNNATGLDLSQYAVGDFGNMDWGAFGTNSAHIQISTGAGANFTGGTYVVSGNASNHINMLQGAGTLSLTTQPAQGTGCGAVGVCFPNAVTYTNFLNMSAGWFVTSSAVSYVVAVSVTAKKYLVQFGASLYLNSAALPGNVGGTVTDSANNRAQLIP